MEELTPDAISSPEFIANSDDEFDLIPELENSVAIVTPVSLDATAPPESSSSDEASDASSNDGSLYSGIKSALDKNKTETAEYIEIAKKINVLMQDTTDDLDADEFIKQLLNRPAVDAPPTEDTRVYETPFKSTVLCRNKIFEIAVAAMADQAQAYIISDSDDLDNFSQIITYVTPSLLLFGVWSPTAINNFFKRGFQNITLCMGHFPEGAPTIELNTETRDLLDTSNSARFQICAHVGDIFDNVPMLHNHGVWKTFDMLANSEYGNVKSVYKFTTDDCNNFIEGVNMTPRPSDVFTSIANMLDPDELIADYIKRGAILKDSRVHIAAARLANASHYELGDARVVAICAGDLFDEMRIVFNQLKLTEDYALFYYWQNNYWNVFIMPLQETSNPGEFAKKLGSSIDDHGVVKFRSTKNFLRDEVAAPSLIDAASVSISEWAQDNVV